MLGARPGDNEQVIALAEALGLPFEVKRLRFNPLCHLGPRILGRSTISLMKSSRASLFREEPPDLTISAGHRSVPAVQALRNRSSTRSVHMGFPRISPSHFDLVVATPQYPIADHPNLIRLPCALTRAAVSPFSEEPMLASLPQPRGLLVVGGPTLFWNLDEEALLGALNDMLDRAALAGGSVMVTTSPRTPAAIARKIKDTLAAAEAPSLLTAPGKPPAYGSLLGAAESILVTADSVSMVSDAIWTEKPMSLVPIEKSVLGRAYFTLMDLLRPGHPVYPQDLRFFWRAIQGVPASAAEDQVQAVLKRVRGLLHGTCS
jgi:mitochondrial fission protein ELM1